jgi:hypothetical protein
MIKDGARPGRGVFLDDIIEHLECFAPDYYQRKSLLMEIKSGTKLYQAFKENGVI